MRPRRLLTLFNDGQARFEAVKPFCETADAFQEHFDKGGLWVVGIVWGLRYFRSVVACTYLKVRAVHTWTSARSGVALNLKLRRKNIERVW